MKQLVSLQLTHTYFHIHLVITLAVQGELNSHSLLLLHFF